jgi:hypothetical protein
VPPVPPVPVGLDVGELVGEGLVVGVGEGEV